MSNERDYETELKESIDAMNAADRRVWDAQRAAIKQVIKAWNLENSK
jgi:hypothetical protein